MSPASKNRLVGTIVIVAIAVIFLPDLLNGSKEQKRDLFVELPATPDIQPVKEPTKFDTDKVKEAVSRKVEIVSEPAVDEPPVDSQATGDGSQAVAITKDVKVSTKIMKSSLSKLKVHLRRQQQNIVIIV